MKKISGILLTMAMMFATALFTTVSAKTATFGTIRIGNTTYGMMNEKKIVNNTSSKFYLECVAGQINCKFEKE